MSDAMYEANRMQNDRRKLGDAADGLRDAIKAAEVGHHGRVINIEGVINEHLASTRWKLVLK